MQRLHDYLDYKKIRVKAKNGTVFVGNPVSVDYAEDNDRNEDMLNIECNGKFYGFYESDISSIEAVF